MKKILVVSDSHGHKSKIETLLETNNYDCVFFLGDGLKDLPNSFNNDFIFAVAGNCDLFFDEPKQRIVIVDKVKFLLVHGHEYKVKWGIGALANEATKRNVNVVCFGHTHSKCIENIDGIVFTNPGSLANGSYIEIDVSDGKILKIENKNLYYC